LSAPPGTHSALFTIGASTNYGCDDYCSPWASFDDLDVDEGVAADTTPPETTITSQPSETPASTSATFDFTANEPASFECSLDDAPFAACTSPAFYSGLADGSHTFQVQATDAAGNADPTPAEQTWTVQAVGDFSIQAGPDSLSVMQGEGGVSSIQTTVTSGSAQAVYLLAAVQPAGAGVGVWFSPSSVMTGDRASMIVNVGVATTPGTYTITVTAVGESWTHTTTLMLTVTCCGSDFAMTVNPSALTLAPGSSGTLTVATTLTSGAPQTVLVSATVDWRAVTGVTYVPGSFTMGDSETITIIVGAAAPPGTYPIGIRATNPNGSALHDTTVDLIVKPGPPSISSFTPASGSAGSTVAIQGVSLTNATSVTIGGTKATYTVDSDSQIRVTVPAGATSGSIQVTTPSGTGTSASSFTVIADTTPPETTITAGPTGTVTSSSATFQFSASEPTTFECSLDTSAFSACSSPTTYTGLGAGSHTFQLRATDTAGNTDPTPAQQTWMVQPNVPPTAHFTVSCTGLTCSFDANASADSDGTIGSYSWDLGDGTTATGSLVSHSFLQAAGYPVTLTVTDNVGATATAAVTVTPIHLAAHAYKHNPLERVALSWNGSSPTGFHVSRDSVHVASVQANAYTDNINRNGSRTYTYQVCSAAIPICSNPATVSF
jgi:hypothetical protein